MGRPDQFVNVRVYWQEIIHGLRALKKKQTRIQNKESNEETVDRHVEQVNRFVNVRFYWQEIIHGLRALKKKQTGIQTRESNEETVDRQVEQVNR